VGNEEGSCVLGEYVKPLIVGFDEIGESVGTVLPGTSE
jgi:hypothetical protein